MRALVFADRDGAGLAPLNSHYAPALLPVAGKELILYTVEDLLASGVREVVFVLPDPGQPLESLLGDGSRWGARFRYVLGRGEPPSALWSRVSLGEDQAVLGLRGDLLRSPAVGSFLVAAQARAGGALWGLAADPRASLILLRPGHGNPAPLLDLLRFDSPATPGSEGVVPLAPGVALPIEDLRAFHKANLDLVAGRLKGLAPAGRELALGLTVGPGAWVSPRSLRQGRAQVGEGSRVSPEAELFGVVVIARDAVVERWAAVKDSVILPHSYLGQSVELDSAIVSGDLLIRVESGETLSFSHAFLSERGDRGSEGPESERLFDRIGGVALLILSAPLWPLALAAAYLGQPGEVGRLMRFESLVGNRSSADAAAAGCDRAFFSWRFNTRIPVLALLPRILAVISGDLTLVGVSPLTPEESQSRNEPWQLARDRAPVGLIGPAQIQLDAAAPLEERLMGDAFYAMNRQGPLDGLRWLVQGLTALFSPRAWRGAATS